jgi:serine/threonine protein kinase
MMAEVAVSFPITPLLCRPEEPDFSRYEWLNAIGSGFSSTVSRVRDRQTGDVFACKTVTRKFIADATMHSLFNREIQIAKSVDHPNIVRLHEVHYLQDSVSLVMDYCPGGTLLQLVERNQHLEELHAARLVLQLMDAIIYLHEQQICHRDLKLENVLLDERGNVKLCDFGFSIVQRPNCLLSTPCGSVAYAAPEVVGVQPYDGRKSDIWSLGIVLYTMCAGYFPWTGTTNEASVIKQIVNSEIEFPFGFSHSLVQLLSGMLEKNPAKRLSAQEVAGTEWARTAKRMFAGPGPLSGFDTIGMMKSPSAGRVRPPVLMLPSTRTKRANRRLPLVRRSQFRPTRPEDP